MSMPASLNIDTTSRTASVGEASLVNSEVKGDARSFHAGNGSGNKTQPHRYGTRQQTVKRKNSNASSGSEGITKRRKISGGRNIVSSSAGGSANLQGNGISNQVRDASEKPREQSEKTRENPEIFNLDAENPVKEATDQFDYLKELCFSNNRRTQGFSLGFNNFKMDLPAICTRTVVSSLVRYYSKIGDTRLPGTTPPSFSEQAAFAVGEEFKTSLTQLAIDTISGFMGRQPDDTQACKDFFNRLKDGSRQIIESQPDYLKQKINTEYAKVDQALKYLLQGRTPPNAPKTVADIMDLLYGVHTAYVAQPFKVFDYEKNYDTKAFDAFIKHTCPKSLHSAFKEIRDNLLEYNNREPSRQDRPQMLFCGPPGVGKTWLIVQFFAQVFNLRVVVCTFSNLNARDVYGQPDYGKDNFDKISAKDGRVNGKFRRQQWINVPLAYDDIRVDGNYGNLEELESKLDREKTDGKSPDFISRDGCIVFGSTNDRARLKPSFLNRWDLFDVDDMDQRARMSVIQLHRSSFFEGYKIKTDSVKKAESYVAESVDDICEAVSHLNGRLIKAALATCYHTFHQNIRRKLYKTPLEAKEDLIKIIKNKSATQSEVYGS